MALSATDIALCYFRLQPFNSHASQHECVSDVVSLSCASDVIKVECKYILLTAINAWISQ
jgi:hypothetical protein